MTPETITVAVVAFALVCLIVEIAAHEVYLHMRGYSLPRSSRNWKQIKRALNQADTRL